jgi:transcription antitermination factor NusG
LHHGAANGRAVDKQPRGFRLRLRAASALTLTAPGLSEHDLVGLALLELIAGDLLAHRILRAGLSPPRPYPKPCIRPLRPCFWSLMPYWAVLRSAPGHDILAYEGVCRAGFETFTPKIRTRVGGRWRTNPLFGCYFFARVVDQWRVLERTIGVLSVVKSAGVPARCPDEEIATLIARSDPDGVIRLSSRLTPQALVRRTFEPCAEVAITDGPFRGFAALHTGMSTRDREMVPIDLLGRKTTVGVPAGLRGRRHHEPGGTHRAARRHRRAGDLARYGTGAGRPLAHAPGREAWQRPRSSPAAGRADERGQETWGFPPRQAKVRRPNAFAAKTAEQRLLRAMADNPGLSVVALANAAGSSRSATGDRLRQLAPRGTVEKDSAGRWKLKREESRQPTHGEELGPQQPSPN